MSNSCKPMDCSPPGTSVHGVSQEYWSGLPFPSPGDLPDPGIKPLSPALQMDFFTDWATRGALQKKEYGETMSKMITAKLGWPKKKVHLSFSLPAYGKILNELFGQPNTMSRTKLCCMYSVLLKNLHFNFLSNQTTCLNMATLSNRLIADKMLYLWKD